MSSLPLRRRAVAALAASVVAVTVLVGPGGPGAEATSRPDGPLVPAGGALFGANVQPRGGWDREAQMATILSREADMGRTFDVLHWSYPWGKTFPTWREPWYLEGGRTPLISWGKANTIEVARGDHDAYIAARADGVKALGAPVFLRWFFEMDGAWTESDAIAPEHFIAAWRRVHGIFRERGATNAVFVWCPTAWGFETGEAPTWYPGDAYVDWVCATAFNFAPGKPNTPWRTFADLLEDFHRWGVDSGKPMMVAAWGAQERDEGEKAEWLRQAGEALPTLLPGIAAVMYYDWDYDYDWRVDTSPSSYQAYLDLAADPYLNPRSAGGTEDGDTPTKPVRRAHGRSRVETAVAVSRSTFSSSTTVVLGRADTFPDALAGAPLAAAHEAPLLITGPAALDDAVAEEVRRLGARRAFLLGGEQALSDAVVAGLRAAGVTDVRRLSGHDRFDTARLVAAEVGGTTAYLAAADRDDRGWPDTLAVSSLAAHERRPILLSAYDRVPDATLAALRELGATAVTLVGGTAALSEAVRDQLEQAGMAVDRIAGDDRYATSLAVAERAERAGLSVASTWVATGRAWPDGLVAGSAVARRTGIMLLVDGTAGSLGEQADLWLARRCATVGEVVVLGGAAAVSDGVAGATANAATC